MGVTQPTIRRLTSMLLLAFFMGAGMVGTSTAQQLNATSIPDSAAISTLDNFRAAIIAGDRVKAGQSLTRDAIIMQAGERATRDEYINKHVIPECELVYSVNQTVDERSFRKDGSVSWISTIYLVDVSQQNGDTIHRKLAELAILLKEKGEWKISMIHWSNCPRYMDP